MKIHSTANNTSHAKLLVRTRYCALSRARLARDDAHTIACESFRDDVGCRIHGRARGDARENAGDFNRPSIGDIIRDHSLINTRTVLSGEVSVNVDDNAHAGTSEWEHCGSRDVIRVRVRENAHRFDGDRVHGNVIGHERYSLRGTTGEPMVIPHNRARLKPTASEMASSSCNGSI